MNTQRVTRKDLYAMPNMSALKSQKQGLVPQESAPADLLVPESEADKIYPQEVINAKIFGEEFDDEGVRYRLSVPINVVFEIYEGDEVLAVTDISPSIAGYGTTLEEAARSLFEDFTETFFLYSDKKDNALTEDAIRLRDRLRKHVERLEDK